MKKRYPVVFLFLALFIALIFLFSFERKKILPKVRKMIPIPTITLTPSPTPFIFKTYTAPKVSQKNVYKIALIGDSMTAALGPHGGEFSDYINALYKKKLTDPQRIVIDNYAVSSNILAVNNELSKKTTINEYTFGPLLSENYDLILVESYAYNPLSQDGIEEGIKQQNRALDQLMTTLITTHPNTAIVFYATIAPNLQSYAKTTQTQNSAIERRQQAEERIMYLKNHIEYAKTHNIPLINIYEKSLTEQGDGNILYINPTDYIHPSFSGVTLIGHELGNFIHDNQILPQ